MCGLPRAGDDRVEEVGFASRLSALGERPTCLQAVCPVLMVLTDCVGNLGVNVDSLGLYGVVRTRPSSSSSVKLCFAGHVSPFAERLICSLHLSSLPIFLTSQCDRHPG